MRIENTPIRSRREAHRVAELRPGRLVHAHAVEGQTRDRYEAAPTPGLFDLWLGPARC